MAIGHACADEAVRIARPALGQEQTQANHDRHFARSQRQRHQRLAIGVLAQRRRVLRSDADRMASLLGQRGIVNDQPGIVTANHPVGFGEQHRLQPRGVPDATGDEVVQLVIGNAHIAGRQRLDTLAIARANQPRDIGRTHPTPRLVPQRRNKRREPTLQVISPISNHGRPLLGRPPMNHANPALGILKMHSPQKNLPK